MNRYEPSPRRAVSFIAALAMAAMTMGTLVVLPAMLEPAAGDDKALANAKALANKRADTPQASGRAHDEPARTAPAHS